jgi:hypothetical protein
MMGFKRWSKKACRRLLPQQEAMDLQVVEHEAIEILHVVDEAMEVQATPTKSVEHAVHKKVTPKN